MVKKLIYDHGNECLILSFNILNLALNYYHMSTCILNDHNMTIYFYFKYKSTLTLHLIVLDITLHHVMLSYLSKLSSMI